MGDRCQGLGLALLLSFGAIGGVMPGSASAGEPLVAQATANGRKDILLKGLELQKEGMELSNKGNPSSTAAAMLKFEEALRLGRENDNPFLQATSLMILGKSYLGLGNPKKALDSFEEALEISHKSSNRKDESILLPRIESILLHGIGESSAALGNTTKAITYYQKSLPFYRALKDTSSEARVLSDIGIVYKTLGDTKNALTYLNQSLEVARILKEDKNEATTINNIGMVYMDSGDIQEALNYFQKALKISLAINDGKGKSVAFTNLGLANYKLSKYQIALDFYNQARSLSVEAKDRYTEARILNMIGMVYTTLDENQKALKYYNESLPIRREIFDRVGEARTLSNIALIYDMKLKQYKEALVYYNQVLVIQRSLDERPGELITLNNIGVVYSHQGNKNEAVNHLRQALVIAEELQNQSQQASISSNIGVLYVDLGNTQKGLDYFNQALPIKRSLGDRNHEAQILGNIATAYQIQNKSTEALSAIDSAIRLFEDMRSEFTNDALKTSYFKSVQDYYQFKIDLLMKLHRSEPSKGYDITALETADQSRGRVLRELLIQSKANLYTNVDPDLLNQEQTANRSIDAREKELAQPNANTQELNQTLAKLYADRDDLKNKIRAKSPAYASLQYPKPTKLADLQQQLDPDTLMLQYSLGDTESYLWVISNTDVKTFILPKRSDIDASAKDFLEKVSSNPNYLHTTTLTQKILTPAATLLGNKRLVIIPDGLLHTIPFAALNLPNRNTYIPLLTEHEITNLPSASTIGILRTTVATKPRAKKTIAVLADPVFTKTDDRLRGKVIPDDQNFDAGNQVDAILSNRIKRGMNLERLPHTDAEAKGILSLVPDERDRISAFGFDANYDWVTSPNLSQYRYIHLATHGFFDGNTPAFSSIVLSGYDSQGRDRKGYLRLPELFNLNLSAELVILSACQTGLGNDVPGEGSVGMTRGLMYAGALRVSSTLWKVDDKATAELMEEFYKNLWQSKKSHAAALRSAQLKLWKEGKVPAFWAAFILQGEWRD
jgi:CHAT domain-containing protein/Flp pilus assembly protein TadD